MKKLAALLALALAALALVACGGSSSTTSEEPTSEANSGAAKESEEKSEGGEGEEKSGGSGSGSSISIEANPEGQLAFVQSSATAKAGKDTLEFTNESPVPHDVKIENSSGEEVGGTEIVSEGSESATVELKPGTYTFFCSVPGHREAGMEGTLTVK
jgi:plastocyanin